MHEKVWLCYKYNSLTKPEATQRGICTELGVIIILLTIEVLLICKLDFLDKPLQYFSLVPLPSELNDVIRMNVIISQVHKRLMYISSNFSLS